MLNNFRFLTAGESHGKCLTAIVDGVPAGLFIDVDFINRELFRRQQGIGRSERQKTEADFVEINAGIHNGFTTGAPLCLVINNKDFSEKPSFSTFRPGHADFTGSVKYNLTDLRDVLERSSARKTCVEVAVGAIAKLFLKDFGIECFSNILQIGNISHEFSISSPDFEKNYPEVYVNEINQAKKDGVSLGGKFEIIYKNLPVGLGSYVQWDRAIDGKLSQSVMSIGGIKAVEIGLSPLGKNGAEYHDEIFADNGKIYRKTNNAGGIEGGITNGENLIIKAVMKPIPTMTKPLKSVDKNTLTPCEAHFERSDTCAVESCAIVAENRIACVLADEFLQKFGSDNMKEIKRNYKDI